ncbi:unnamed protein product [Plutella xylostella]|uniref:(diamondback moth) hypothetical protein n=1 Tax=Plutella xylostella TaxID=51655 RepID=A0A8S4ENQ5_PLUXY|nr:unnamed protein product [Plutella xylostella]
MSKETKLGARCQKRLSSHYLIIFIPPSLTAFGPDVRITVRCLQVLVKGIDAKSLVKNCPEFIRTSMLTFFNNVADDLGHTIHYLQDGKYSHLRGTHLKTSTSLGYINGVIMPVLTAMFDHLANCEYGADLLRK